MKPMRMCMVCRTRREKQELIRVTADQTGEVSLDRLGKAPGRGAYFCKQKKCIQLARKRRTLERAFSRPIEASVYDKLEKEAEAWPDEL